MASEAEQCVPWEPVPQAASRYMVLNVALFEQMVWGGPQGMPVSVVMVSSLQGEPSGRRSVLAWRIRFQSVAAYHVLPIGMWSGTRPYEFSADGRREPLQIATWELLNSRWLAADVPSDYHATKPRHHYVIASSENVYEIAAASWESEELGNWAQVRSDLEARWAQEHGPKSVGGP